MVLLFKGTKPLVDSQPLVLVVAHPGPSIMHTNWLAPIQYKAIQLGLDTTNKLRLKKTTLIGPWPTSVERFSEQNRV